MSIMNSPYEHTEHARSGGIIAGNARVGVVAGLGHNGRGPLPRAVCKRLEVGRGRLPPH